MLKQISVCASRSIWGVILAFGIPSAILLVAIASSIAQDGPAAADNEPFAVTIRGTLLLPDGSIAKDAVLEQPPQDSSDIVSATITNGEFEVKTTGTKLNSLGLLCRTGDGSHQTLLSLRGDAIRPMCASPQRVTLSPSKTIRVIVSDRGQAVPDARVEFSTGTFEFTGKTRANGVAELKIPADQDAFMVNAWTDDFRIGALHVLRDPNQPRDAREFSIEVSRREPVRVVVVDAFGNPVPNVPLQLRVIAGEHGEKFAQNRETSQHTSNERGEAVFKWIPDWEGQHTYLTTQDDCAWYPLGDSPRKTLADGTVQLTVAPILDGERVLVEGQLAGATGDVTGMFIEFWSFRGQEAARSDVLFALADAQGRFRAKVLAGSSYSVYVNDKQLVSNNWGGLISLGQGAPINPPQLTLSQGVTVEVLVTRGSNQQPLQNAWVHLESSEKERSGRRFWRRTDGQGRATAQVLPGELEVRVSDNDWQSTQTIPVADGQPAKVSFHREQAEKIKITGKLVLPAGVTTDLAGTTIQIKAMDGESKGTAVATSDAKGNFSAAIMAKRVSILAMSPAEKYFGQTIADLGEGTLEIPVHPTVRLTGQLLGLDDQPVAGASVRMVARLTDQFATFPKGRRPYETRFVDLYRNRTVKTDQDGYFEFPTAPQRIELSLHFKLQGAEEELSWSNNRYLEPGQEPAREVFRIPTKLLTAVPTAPERPLPLAMEDLIRDSRLAGIHALVILSGAGNISQEFGKRLLHRVEAPKQIYSYLPKTIHGPDAAQRPDQRDYLSTHGWTIPDENAVLLLALDGNAKELGRLTLNLRENKSASQEAIAFLSRHLPPQHDAQQEFQQALAEAKKSGRHLWVRVGGTRCRPCFEFSRWLDDQRELLAKDYVVFKFDGALDQHGHELSMALKLDDHGIPCHAILDGDGKELTNSIGPMGNIGNPGGDAEGARHLRKMLKATARKLTDADIETLIRSIPQE